MGSESSSSSLGCSSSSTSALTRRSTKGASSLRARLACASVMLTSGLPPAPASFQGPSWVDFAFGGLPATKLTPTAAVTKGWEGLGNDEWRIKFARRHGFLLKEDDDVFHFVAYVPSGGKVYELDGLKAGPIDLGSFEDSWLPVARSAIEARIQKYAASEIKFNLMAIVRDKRAALEDAKAAADAATAAELDAELAREHAKRADWAAENVRRHHNYVPFVVDLLKVLAEQGKLGAMMDDAKAKASTDANKRQKV